MSLSPKVENQLLYEQVVLKIYEYNLQILSIEYKEALYQAFSLVSNEFPNHYLETYS